MQNRQRLIDFALSYAGYLEKKSNRNLEDFTANAGDKNFTIFASWYKELCGENYQGQPWCAMFVSTCFYKVFGRADICPPFAYCPTGVSRFKELGAFYGKPEKGDVIFFTNGKRAYHTGIVTDVINGRVYTVEGNTSGESGVVENGGAVAKKAYVCSNPKILGYGRPRYALLKEEDIMTAEEKQELEALKLRLEALEKNQRLVYRYGGDVPEWARDALWKAQRKGIFKGASDEDLNVSEDCLKALVYMDRAGAFNN